MSAQYRDNLNKPYLKSLYSNATARQNCVPCPSSCSCNLGGRSVMDRLMIQAWQEGPEGHPGVFSHLSGGGHHSAPHHHPHPAPHCAATDVQCNSTTLGKQCKAKHLTGDALMGCCQNCPVGHSCDFQLCMKTAGGHHPAPHHSTEGFTSTCERRHGVQPAMWRTNTTRR